MSFALFDLTDEFIPGQLLEIAANTDQRTAMVLLELYPGSHVYIPPEPVDGHKLADRLTVAEFKALCKRYGKNVLKIPKADKARRQYRNQRILHDYFVAKMRQGDIALQYGVEERTVSKICNTVAISPQTDLFAIDD
ncbi:MULTISPECIES: Mor transcription activator family protein [Methylobacter]